MDRARACDVRFTPNPEDVLFHAVEDTPDDLEEDVKLIGRPLAALERGKKRSNIYSPNVPNRFIRSLPPHRDLDRAEGDDLVLVKNHVLGGFGDFGVCGGAVVAADREVDVRAPELVEPPALADGEQIGENCVDPVLDFLLRCDVGGRDRNLNILWCGDR